MVAGWILTQTRNFWWTYHCFSYREDFIEILSYILEVISSLSLRISLNKTASCYEKRSDRKLIFKTEKSFIIFIHLNLVLYKNHMVSNSLQRKINLLLRDFNATRDTKCIHAWNTARIIPKKKSQCVSEKVFWQSQVKINDYRK